MVGQVLPPEPNKPLPSGQEGSSDTRAIVCTGDQLDFYTLINEAADVGDISQNLFEWSVYGGQITGTTYGSFTVGPVNTLQGNGHYYSTATVSNIPNTAAQDTSKITIQWDNTEASDAWIAVRQISAYGCSDDSSTVFYIHVQTPPIDLPVNDDIICVGEQATITIDNSELGVEYQLRLDADDLPVGVPVAGDGGTISFTVTPINTATYNILATNTTSGCFAELTDKPVVTVNPLPDDGLTVLGSATCPGDAGTVTVEGSVTGVDYQLRLESDNSNVGSPLSGTGGTITFDVNPLNTTAYNILAIDVSTGCSVALLNTATVIVEDIINPVISATFPDRSECAFDETDQSLNFQNDLAVSLTLDLADVDDNCTDDADLIVQYRVEKETAPTVFTIEQDYGADTDVSDYEFTEGTYRVTYRVTDESGNSSTISFTITIEHKPNPSGITAD